MTSAAAFHPSPDEIARRKSVFEQIMRLHERIGRIDINVVDLIDQRDTNDASEE